jgi:DNA primase
VREFGKEKFELEVKKAMPLSQYIVEHLIDANPLNSQEDRVKFLNEAEPILRQITAPRTALFMRKKIAELAQVTEAEMQSLLKLPAPNRAPAQSTQRQSRAPVSIKKRFVLMLLMQPNLAKPEHLTLAQGFAEEDVLLQASIHAALGQPQSKPAALLHTIESQIEPRLLHEIQRELQLLDDSLDFALEFEGASAQLEDMAQQKQDVGILEKLKEIPLNSLTSEQREMLARITAKKSK